MEIKLRMIIRKKDNKGKSLSEIAYEVINGKWGTGNDRINRLKKAGCDPRKVQVEVNRK